MSKYIIVQKHGRPSTKKVFEQMQSNDVTMMHKRTLPNNVYYREYKKGRNGFVKVRQFNPNSGDIIVRWGNRIPYEGDGYICYNNIKSQERAHDKKKVIILAPELTASIITFFRSAIPKSNVVSPKI